jgi:hypothetical protein
MPDNETTRKYEPTRRIQSDETEKTRLVRRPADSNDDSAQHFDQPKTHLVGRVAKNATGDELSEDRDSTDRPVVGWLVVIHGPGRGKFAALFDGLNSIGRGADQSTQLDFGDEAISRSEHAYISYDHMSRSFKIQHGGKANLVRLNSAPVLQPIDIKSGDRIIIGRTELAFVPFCGEGFDWEDTST